MTEDELIKEEPLKFLGKKLISIAQTAKEGIDKNLDAVVNAVESTITGSTGDQEKQKDDSKDIKNRLSRAKSQFAIYIKGIKLHGKSLYYFSDTSAIRVLLARLITSKTFKFLINMLILLNCYLLTYETPLTDPTDADK
mmetsp:Transcript_38065/g.34056  ORF Transcript_38065/g.34056 Transcript_38065/m.34056 type:complete len:139 (-) Transcript_38065:324-740(-)